MVFMLNFLNIRSMKELGKLKLNEIQGSKKLNVKELSRLKGGSCGCVSICTDNYATATMDNAVTLYVSK